MNTRIYVVTVGTGTTSEQKLVDATSAAQAIRHIARGMIDAQVATTKDVALLVGKGSKVEIAAEEK